MVVTAPHKIVLADSQFLVRLGLKQLLANSEKFEVVGEAGDADQLLSLVQKHLPRVVIFDHNNPEFFQVENIAQAKALSPETQFLIISADTDKDNIYHILDLGGIGFLTKECESDEILAALQATARGEKFLCHKIIEIILESKQNKEEDVRSLLSQREIEIIQLTASGLPAKLIAEKLYLSPHTVYTHRKNIMKKLGVNSASEMVLYAINAGIKMPKEVVQ